MFCVRCELESNTFDKISDKREQLPEQQSIENEARAGTHDHVRPEPLHSVPLWSLTTACVSSPDEMGHLFQVAQGQCLCLIATKKSGKKERKRDLQGYLPTRLIKLICLQKVTRNRAVIEVTKKNQNLSTRVKKKKEKSEKNPNPES